MLEFSPVLLSAEIVQAAPKVLKSLSHDALFLLLFQICLLLAVARGLGEWMRTINQPPVVGELIAGVVLGPSVLGLLFPQIQAEIFPKVQAQADLLSVVAWVGVLFLLIVTGLETDLNLIVRKGKSALMISLGGIFVPFITGLGLGYLLPDAFLANPEQRLLFSLFMAVAMSISAVPVIAKVLMDLKLIRRDIGQVTLAAAMTDDTIGWILLSVVAGLATSGSVDLLSAGRSVGGAVLFLSIAFTVGRTVVAQIIALVDKTVGGTTAQLSVILVMAFGVAALTHEMGIEAVLGAFVVGILAGQAPRFRQEVGHTLELVTAGFLAPIFFASAGLKVDLVRLLDPQVLTIGLLVLAVACIGKFVGVYLGAWAGGLSHWERIAMGSGMNARGAMEIIVATVGLGLGVLNLEMYSIIVMVAIVTSLMAPPLLRWSLSHVEIGKEEAERLEREKIAATSFVRSINRVLLPSRGGTNVQLAAQLVGHLSRQQPIQVTALYATAQAVQTPRWKFWDKKSDPMNEDGAQVAIENIREELKLIEGPDPEVRVEAGKNAADIILAEAAKGYDLVVMGATEAQKKMEVWNYASEALFSNLVDRVVQDAPCAMLIVKSHLPMGDFCNLVETQSLRRILVPTVGTEYSKHAVEIAAVIAASVNALLTVVHVISRPKVDNVLMDRRNIDPMKEIGQQIVDQQADLARKLGAEVETLLLEGVSPEAEIIRLANQDGYDLIVMGSNLRPISGRAFFGHRVDGILNQATCPVAVVSSS